MARVVREQYPQAKLILAADNDVHDEHLNGGIEAAQKAAAAVGGFVAIPKLDGDKCDFNDLYVARGAEAVRAAIEAAQAPGPPQREAAPQFTEAIRPSEATPTTPAAENDLDSLLRDIESHVKRFVAYPSVHACVAHVLWIAHTHTMDAWESTPRIVFQSPEWGSGKTRALEVSATLVPRPVESVNATPAYLFRKVSDPEGRPTILYDEIDTVFGPKAKTDNEEVRGMINAGHRKGARAGRCVTRGREIATEEFEAYCAVALAGLGNLPDTIRSRSVIVRMRRRAPNEHVEPYRRRENEPQGHALRDQLATWAPQALNRLAGARPRMPKGVEDRAADVWEALLSVADMAGGKWPERARDAAIALVRASVNDTPSLGVRLLADMRIVFGDAKAIATTELLGKLHGIPEAPWSDLYRGKPLDARRLAELLREYGIKSKNVRLPSATQAKGYERADLVDTWNRYLTSLSPLSPEKGVPSVPNVSEQENQPLSGTDSGTAETVAPVSVVARSQPNFASGTGGTAGTAGTDFSRDRGDDYYDYLDPVRGVHTGSDEELPV